ncbi:MAG: M48 family metallopeptidase, partial [Candidatus Pacearchaeota archaeon]
KYISPINFMKSPVQRISFYDQISRNKRKSFFLIVIIFLTFCLLGYIIGKVYEGYFFFIMIVAIIFSLVYIVGGYYNSDKIALASVNAFPALREDFPRYHNIVEGLCLASGLSKPKLYVMESNQINAFATGRDPKHAVICVTTGALEKLNKVELEGVLAHELSHIANFDIRFMTLTAVLVGMIAIISQLFLRSLWFRSSGDRGRGNTKAFLMFIGILLAILAPIFTQLVQLAISRKREFMADASAVKFTRYNQGLINALKKIKQEHMPERKVNKAVAPLFMSDPFRRQASSLFQTHPSIDQRIRVLERM